MISFLFAFAALVWLLMAYRRDMAFLFVSCFLAWQFALKVMATTFLDNFGPIYSDEVFVWVGGHGASTPLMVVSALIPLMVIKVAINRKTRLQSAPEPHLTNGGTSLGDITFWFMSFFIVALFVDMVRIGQIPFFTGTERFDYEGGVFHRFLISYLFLIGFGLGAIVVRSRFVTGTWDFRFAGVLMGLFLYLLLAGHRFGGFYVIITAGLFSFAALWIGPRVGIAPAPPAQTISRFQAALRSRALIASFVVVLLSFIAIGMYNSLYNVRDNAPQDALVQRFFVQPAHLYYLSWERVQGNAIAGFSQVYNFLQNPFDPGRNSGIQFLMYLHLGAERAYQIYVRQGVDYAGGYPEIFLEMGGIPAVIIAALFVSIAVGILYRICIMAVVSGRLVTALASFYFCWTFINVILGGMVETFTATSFWLKAIAFAVLYVMERSLERSGRRLTPWYITPAR